MKFNYSINQGIKKFTAAVTFEKPVDIDFTFAAGERIFNRIGSQYRGGIMGSEWLSSRIPVLTIRIPDDNEKLLLVEKHSTSVPAIMFGTFYMYLFTWFNMVFLYNFNRYIIEKEGIRWAEKIIDFNSSFFQFHISIFGFIWKTIEPFYNNISAYLVPALTVLLFYGVSRTIQFYRFKKSCGRFFETVREKNKKEKNPHLTLPQLPVRKTSLLSFSSSQVAPIDLSNLSEKEYVSLIQKADFTISNKESEIEKTGNIFRLYRKKTWSYVSFYPRKEGLEIEVHGSLVHTPYIYSAFFIMAIYLSLLAYNAYVLFAPLRPEGASAWSPPGGMLELQTMAPWFPALVFGPVLGFCATLAKVQQIKKRITGEAKYYVTVIKALIREK